MSIKTAEADSLNLKKNLLYTSLQLFYESLSSDDMRTFLDIITGKSKISLRIIDWFVTNYSKKNNIVYYIVQPDSLSVKKGKPKSLKKKRLSPRSRYQENAPDRVNSSTKQFFVYQRYRSQLTSYHKIKFDPFCRNDRIVNWGPNNDITTTVAQLNFFKWAIENRILDYIKEHLKDIEVDMNTNIRPNKKKKSSGKKKTIKASTNLTSEGLCDSDSSGGGLGPTKRKRRELSSNASKTLNKHNTKIVLEFD